MASATASQLPAPEQPTHFILIEPKSENRNEAPLVSAWKRAIAMYFPNEREPPFTVLEGKLEELDANLLECDCMVSPANSFGIMDGGWVTNSSSGLYQPQRETSHVSLGIDTTTYFPGHSEATATTIGRLQTRPKTT